MFKPYTLICITIYLTRNWRIFASSFQNAVLDLSLPKKSDGDDDISCLSDDNNTSNSCIAQVCSVNSLPGCYGYVENIVLSILSRITQFLC